MILQRPHFRFKKQLQLYFCSQKRVAPEIYTPNKKSARVLLVVNVTFGPCLSSLHAHTQTHTHTHARTHTHTHTLQH